MEYRRQKDKYLVFGWLLIIVNHINLQVIFAYYNPSSLIYYLESETADIPIFNIITISVFEIIAGGFSWG